MRGCARRWPGPGSRHSPPTSAVTSGSERWVPRCSPGSDRGSCSSTNSTRATSICPTTSSTCSRRAGTRSPSWRGSETLRRARTVVTADASARVPVTGGPGRLPCLPLRGRHQQRRAPVPARVPAPLRAAGHPAAGPGRARQHRQGPAGSGGGGAQRDIIKTFMLRREQGDLATDQLLNAIYLAMSGSRAPGETRDRLLDRLLRSLDSAASAMIDRLLRSSPRRRRPPTPSSWLTPCGWPGICRNGPAAEASSSAAHGPSPPFPSVRRHVSPAASFAAARIRRWPCTWPPEATGTAGRRARRNARRRTGLPRSPKRWRLPGRCARCAPGSSHGPIASLMKPRRPSGSLIPACGYLSCGPTPSGGSISS